MDKVRLEPAYCKTQYQVCLGQHWLNFQIGQYDAWPEKQIVERCGGFQEWAIITPCNPASAALCEQENAARVENWQNWLEAHPYRWLASRNHDPSNNWPDEPGAMILDITLAEAQALGQAYGQAAIVHGRIGLAPELVWLETARNYPAGSTGCDTA